MTGLAQVNGLREHDSSDQKTHYDLRYVCEWTPVVDLVLLLQTVWTLLARFFEGPADGLKAADGRIPRAELQPSVRRADANPES